MGAALAVLDRGNLKDSYVREIADRYHRIYRDAVEIGSMLVEARKTLEPGTFKRMVENELPFTRQSAYNYMREYALSQPDAVKPVLHLSDAGSVKIELARLDDSEIERGLATGRLYQGVPRAEVIEYRREIRSQHVHGPEKNYPPPSRPEVAALSYSELVYCLIEWRKSKNMSQEELDHRIGWGEGQTSKYEIPHRGDDGRIAHFDPKTGVGGSLAEWMQGLGVGLAVVPLD